MNCLIDIFPFTKFDFGPTHPFKIHRLELTYKLIAAYNLIDLPQAYQTDPQVATEEEMLSFHSKEYLETLCIADKGIWHPKMIMHGFGTGDNPLFPGVYGWASLVAGASITAATQLINGKANTVFNFAGGLHHAMPTRAAGFCHINDVVLAIKKLLEHYDRVAYIDIDAHHGDGVQHAFYSTDRVMTISIHQSGNYIFPGTGFPHETGNGAGQGFAVNIPLLPGAGDSAFQLAMKEVILPLINAYDPPVIVTQLGADALTGDTIASLAMSLHGFEQIVQTFKDLRRPWLALGGGGYNIGNVVRAWTLTWAVMNDVVVDDEIPANWRAMAARWGVDVTNLRKGDHERFSYTAPDRVLADLEQVIAFLRHHLFPLHNLR
ncbi:acetoin utilization protein AcuC [Candidatus Acetothermia bacterium]|jgi:acetoin utilization protein AcuC|nr:acetoin utilization protein AcuC [Candidatus Acetothermia bacterium]MCI2427366.1 acetoin utilization protein AcuC [Candidatus Acetothermia bacterium]MCI2428371.1 acetoin utilization protein AcuC [Candidatus Acetothermia bacterium]